jgi:hypothetical protein
MHIYIVSVDIYNVCFLCKKKINSLNSSSRFHLSISVGKYENILENNVYFLKEIYIPASAAVFNFQFLHVASGSVLLMHTHVLSQV